MGENSPNWMEEMGVDGSDAPRRPRSAVMAELEWLHEAFGHCASPQPLTREATGEVAELELAALLLKTLLVAAHVARQLETRRLQYLYTDMYEDRAELCQAYARLRDSMAAACSRCPRSDGMATVWKLAWEKARTATAADGEAEEQPDCRRLMVAAVDREMSRALKEVARKMVTAPAEADLAQLFDSLKQHYDATLGMAVADGMAEWISSIGQAERTPELMEKERRRLMEELMGCRLLTRKWDTVVVSVEDERTCTVDGVELAFDAGHRLLTTMNAPRQRTDTPEAFLTEAALRRLSTHGSPRRLDPDPVARYVLANRAVVSPEMVDKLFAYAQRADILLASVAQQRPQAAGRQKERIFAEAVDPEQVALRVRAAVESVYGLDGCQASVSLGGAGESSLPLSTFVACLGFHLCMEGVLKAGVVVDGWRQFVAKRCCLESRLCCKRSFYNVVKRETGSTTPSQRLIEKRAVDSSAFAARVKFAADKYSGAR